MITLDSGVDVLCQLEILVHRQYSIGVTDCRLWVNTITHSITILNAAYCQPYTFHYTDASSGSGGYSSLIGPHRRFSYAGCGRKSSESPRVLSAYPMGGSFGIDDYFVETDGDEADDEFDQMTASGDAERAQMHLAVAPPKVYNYEII